MRRAFIVMLALALVGCHRQQGGSAGGGRNLITREEIERTGGISAYDVIARLRADFLADRGRTSIMLAPQNQASVFLADQYYGEIVELRNLRADQVEQIRFYPGTEAVVRFGAKYGGGVIQIQPRN
jgi:hypothetical protein